MGVILGVATLGAGSPILAALAVADITLTTADIIVAVQEDELMKIEGREFLNNWNKIMLVGGINHRNVSDCIFRYPFSFTLLAIVYLVAVKMKEVLKNPEDIGYSICHYKTQGKVQESLGIAYKLYIIKNDVFIKCSVELNVKKKLT